MRTMNFKLITALLASSLFMVGCSDNEVSVDPAAGDVTANSATTSLLNFSILVSEVDPAIIDSATGVFTKTDLDVTAYIGDRANRQITAPRTIFFKSEYGLIESSCTTDETGSCQVKWSFIDRPGSLPGDGGNDGFTTVVAYTAGEESFTDNNGNGIFDDNDSGIFRDQEEPYIDFELRSGLPGDGIFDGNDVIVDTVNGNDLTGVNLVHDIADGFFNGGGCTHSSLCSTTVTSPVIWTALANGIFGTTGQTFTVGGDLAGLAGASVTLQNNVADDLTLTANGMFTFATQIADAATYAVTVSAQPAGETCIVANGTGTIATANVTNVTVTCATTMLTVGGNVTGTAFPGGTSITIQNNAANDIVIPDTGPFSFTFPAQADLTGYAVTVSANTTALTCTITGGGNNDGTGTLAGTNITNVDINCI